MIFLSKQLSMDIMEAVQKMTSPRRPIVTFELQLYLLELVDLHLQLNFVQHNLAKTRQ